MASTPSLKASILVLCILHLLIKVKEAIVAADAAACL
jgi:hypothetical protein